MVLSVNCVPCLCISIYTLVVLMSQIKKKFSCHLYLFLKISSLKFSKINFVSVNSSNFVGIQKIPNYQTLGIENLSSKSDGYINCAYD